MSSVQPQSTLRRRMHILERAHSLSGHNISSNISKIPKPQDGELGGKEDSHEEEAAQSLTDYETGSESSRSEVDGLAPENDEEPSKAKTNIAGEEEHQRGPTLREHHVSHSSRSKSWYEFDLAVVAALVSPIGNWLTGGDHIKDITLVMLLIFYLHQVIEVPWSLYHSARPRRNSHDPVIPHNVPEAERFQKAAMSELRLLEFFFLALSIVSPLLGAILLRYVTFAVTGDDIHESWFSTGLFVLATGIRPWSHLVRRLTQRVTDLHDVVHYPSAENPYVDEFTRQMTEMRKQADLLEASLNKVRQRMMKETEEVYDYVDGAVDSVEKIIKKHERKCEKHDGKIKDMEMVVNALKTRRLKLTPVKLDTPPPVSTRFFLPHRVYSALFRTLPSWLAPPQEFLYELRSSPSSTVTRYAVPSLSSPDGLETIPEEGLSGARHSPASVESKDSEEAPVPSLGFGGRLFLRFAYLTTFPIRSVSRMIFGYS